MVNPTEIEHILFYEENGNLCYSLTDKHRRFMNIFTGGLLLLAAASAILLTVRITSLHKGGDSSLGVPGGVLLATLPIVALAYVVWFAVRVNYVRIVFDQVKGIVTTSEKRPIRLEEISAIVVTPDSGEDSGRLTFKTSSSDKAGKFLMHLIFCKRASAHQAATLIANYLNVPIEVRNK